MRQEERLATGGGISGEAAESLHQRRVDPVFLRVAGVAAVDRVGHDQSVDPGEVLGDLQQRADAAEPRAEGADDHAADPGIVGRIRSLPPSQLAITIISVEEQLSSWFTRLRRARTQRELAEGYRRLTENVRFLSRLTILTFTEPAIQTFERLKTMRLNVGAMDLRIAAIVLEHRASVATRNVRDFARVPGLTVEDWN